VYKFDKTSLHVSWNIARSVHVVKSRSEVLRNGLPEMKIKLGCEAVGSRCFSRGYVFDDVEDFSYSEWSLEQFVIIVVSRTPVHDVPQKVVHRRWIGWAFIVQLLIELLWPPGALLFWQLFSLVGLIRFQSLCFSGLLRIAGRILSSPRSDCRF